MNQDASTQGTSSIETEEKTWNIIHNLPLQPKIRMFLRRATSGILPIGRNFIRHRLYESISCTHCGYTVKDDRHALFDYIFSEEVWRNLPNRQKWRLLPSSSFRDLIFSISVEHSEEELAIFGTIVWVI